ncbi:two-component response regulator-like APRR9 isoform X1 [Arachis duranensis]|uniref:Two-component response regulator-like APRR9 isoform X1 n=1 Tax=Arachis duranensis TaxID=130453 RepID=A0A6P4DMH7_ARADU|nr:two-component response regulator-like APRR9 isoform X1 [Arachis duranensis]
MQMQEEQIMKLKDENAPPGDVVVRWEKFLPRMALRVLLVEADDSTRQIISALLRKCSYKVAAVPDGLKAWETLKSKAPEIDLILTEVELPSISGFSLLTLIMEHDICKTIPVIMMSTNDSISMVFKCMLKGAADFLIKPIRRNELRNLWQHVWRRHAISGSHQSLTLPQNKFEVAAENNATSNNSSGSVASPQKNREYSGEKASDAQVTSPLKSFSKLINIDTVKHEEATKFERESATHYSESGEKSNMFVSDATRCYKTLNATGVRLDQGFDCDETENEDEVLRTELSKAHSHINTEINKCNDTLVEPSTGAIDLIATFENSPKSTGENCSFNADNTFKSVFDTQLGLSLRRDSPSSSCKLAPEERKILNHSTASAFSWYSSSKLLQPLFPSQSITSAKLSSVSCNSHESHKSSENTHTHHQHGDKIQDKQNMTTLVTQTGQIEPKSPNDELGFSCATGVSSDHNSMGNANAFPRMPCAQSAVHPIWTPKPVSKKENSSFPTSASSHSNPETDNSECHRCSDDATYTSDQNGNDQSKMDCVRHDSAAAAGQSASTSFYLENHNSSGAYGSIGSGSDANATSAVVTKNNPFADSSQHSHDGFRGTDSHRSSQREAALTKFRLKRKERCYEKKVRYQSRKRLAEQRPRVKGQFVRQVQNDHPVAGVGGS